MIYFGIVLLVIIDEALRFDDFTKGLWILKMRIVCTVRHHFFTICKCCICGEYLSPATCALFGNKVVLTSYK